jgi:serine/threonine protein kinase
MPPVRRVIFKTELFRDEGSLVDGRLGLPVSTVLDGSYRITRVVGSGGFGITYEAEDVNLGTQVAVKEYYPFDFGDRDATMSVRPKSERHSETFDWGRSNFLQEARTLARFEHPSIVRVTRVFEANSTAYMVMRFEQGQSFEDWLRGLGRLPTQDELDAIVAPLLDALEMLHAVDFLHRDIAPDNVIVRADGSPVLLDFGSARRAVAAMSRTMTGIVKAGYSPNEQYSSDSRHQGPWSDLYALGGMLYRAVTGHPPDEATLRVSDDRMLPAASIDKKGKYRSGFLAAIDACLRVRYADRPRSVALLRPMLLGKGAVSKPRLERQAEAFKSPSKPQPKELTLTGVSFAQRPTSKRWVAIAAAIVAVLGGSIGGYEFSRTQPTDSEAEFRRKTAIEAQHQADIAAAAKQKSDERALAWRQGEERTAAEKRAAADERTAAAERARQEAEAKRLAEAIAAKKAEEERIAAIDSGKTQDTASTVPLGTEERASFVKRVQEVLKINQCYDGAVNGNSGSDAQKALDHLVDSAHKKGKEKPVRIELAKATASDFDTWLRDTENSKGDLCVVPRPKAPVQKQRSARETSKPSPRRASPSYGGGGGGTIQGVR